MRCSTENRNLILAWITHGKIFDAGANLPENFYDSKSTLLCRICDHVIAITDGHVITCDLDFMTIRNLSEKIVKLKGNGEEITDKDKAMTHIRKCTEWGNNALAGSFRRLRTKIPTDNAK